MKTSELREKYLEFFKKKNHKVFPSDTLVPNDSSLLFTSAGMNQFKAYFLGDKRGVDRAVTCQKCLRAGDLDEVGKTAYHHTFFEMLGNFSFGNYFKKEAIEFGWEFLTKVLNIKEKDLWVSVYKDDDEVYTFWKNYIGVPGNKIIKLGEDSNFWPANAPGAGPNGLCGPCSEIFFDNGKKIGCGKKECNPDCGCGRFVEIWNLVFTQFNRVGVNKLELLSQKNIDTGMGLERMTAVLGGKESNFQIDILAPVVDLVKKILKVKFVGTRPPSTGSGQVAVSSKETSPLINAVVDHARAATFAIADGVYPSNEGRGYVIRKIIRRALLKARGLDSKQPFLFRLPELFAELMGGVYPEIKQKKDSISKIILSEEEKYFLMLKEGKIQVDFIMNEIDKTTEKKIGSKDMFRLYDTYGLPLELIKEFVKVKGFSVDEKEFRSLLKEQQERSRKKSMFDESIFSEGGFDLKEKSEFIGYDKLEGKCRILKLFVDNAEKKIIEKDEQALIILDRSPFYTESGGQLNDEGQISTKDGEFRVDKVFKAAEAIIHQGRVISGEIKKSDAIACVDKRRREALARAHTATHLLQAALRQVLGKHVMQQGSLVDEDKFRFDFTHFNKLNDVEIEKVESLVKGFISNADKVEKKELSLDDAKKEGALAFFKEKYHNKVRMVSISNYSKELCGGSHTDNTSEIGSFAIISESSISSGIRRIEAFTGGKKGVSILTRRKEKEQISKALDEKKKANQVKIIETINDWEKEFIAPKTGDIIGLDNIEGMNVLLRIFEPEISLKALTSQVILALSDRIRQRIGSVLIFIATGPREKNIFVCSATDDIIKKGFSCKKFISEFGKELSLSGGGNDKKIQGVVLNRGNDFINRVKEAISKFIKK